MVSAATDLLLIPNVGTRGRPLFDATVEAQPGRWGNLVLPFQQLVDYNRDGCVDLLEGESVRLCSPERAARYDRSPVIALVPGGKRIHHPSPSGDHWDYRALADLDGDGLQDLLVGDHQGHVWFHRDEGSAGAPRIDASGHKLTLEGGADLRVGMPPTPEDGNQFDELQGARTTVSSGDFNHDGRLDLLVGDTYGVIHLFLRAPGDEPAFQAGRSLARLVNIRLVAVGTDWNHDGWDDVLVTYAGSQTYLLLNRATEGAAEFDDPMELKLPEYPMSWPLLHVADWNGDGDQDVLFHYGTMIRLVERSFIDHGYVPGKVIATERRPASASRGAARPAGLEHMAVAPSSHYAHNAYPTIARLADGRLICVFTARDARTRDKYVIAAAFSEDNGRTWGPPGVVLDTPGSLDFDPGIVVVGQRVLVTSTACPPSHLERISTSRTMAVASDDDARTWSELFEIPMGHRYTCGKINPGVLLDDGTAIFGFSWDGGLERDGSLAGEGRHDLIVGTMSSDDAGRTWKLRGEVRLAARREDCAVGAINGVDEPAIVRCGDGALYMLCRTGLDRLYESRSTDGGMTWSDPAPSSLTSHNAPASLCRIEGARPGILAVWCNSREHRWPLCAAASFDDGRTWTVPRVISRVEGYQSSYPGCVQAADGALVVVWQQDRPDGHREVLGARFDVEWMLDAKVQ